MLIDAKESGGGGNKNKNKKTPHEIILAWNDSYYLMEIFYPNVIVSEHAILLHI